jgi:acetylornithine deacetylase/succinyl-diaminopimelate desuccinylase-like protein
MGGLEEARARLEARDEAILADQVTLAEIPAPTGSEERRARWMTERLRAARLDDVQSDDAGNVIGTRRGVRDDAPVVVCAHLDTVFGPEVATSVRRERGRLSAPGIGDNARGLAALVALADAFGGDGGLRPQRPILFSATTGEEGTGDLRGARHLFQTVAERAHCAIAIDGAGDERVVACALGCRRYRVEYAGPGGHSWASFGAPNAVHAAAGLAARLSGFPLASRPRATITVSRIGGGSAVNAIPAQGWLEVDMRSTSSVELARLDRQLRVAAQDALDEENARRKHGTPPLSVVLRPISDRPAGEVPESDALVQAALSATRSVGRTPELAVASTDANIPISLGIPAVAIGGGGRGGDTHTTHEWYENYEGTRGVVRALVLLASAAGL